MRYQELKEENYLNPDLLKRFMQTRNGLLSPNGNLHVVKQYKHKAKISKYFRLIKQRDYARDCRNKMNTFLESNPTEEEFIEYIKAFNKVYLKATLGFAR